MMDRTWKKPEPYLTPGMRIKGKWNKKEYVIRKKLGEGAIGTVYLCTENGKQAALKISEKGASITMEVNVLKAMDKAREKNLGPHLLDVDDWLSSSGFRYSFYVMEYVQGESLSQFVKRHGTAWIGVFMLQLLDDLDKLHQEGWIFGDLKNENLIVSPSPARIRWIDVGGTTKTGRAIKEYTEFYDRGYWGLGSRRADPGYDLFAFVMVFISIFYPDRFEKKEHARQQIFKKIDAVKALRPYHTCLKKAVLGKYDSSVQMRQEISATIHKQQNNHHDKKHGRAFAIESFGLFSIALMYYLASIFLF